MNDRRLFLARHAHSARPVAVRPMDPAWERGTLELERQNTALGAGAHRLDAAGIEPCVECPR